MPRFKSINFCQNIPKIKLFFEKKMLTFDPLGSGGSERCSSTTSLGGGVPQNPETVSYCRFLAEHLSPIMFLQC